MAPPLPRRHHISALECERQNRSDQMLLHLLSAGAGRHMRVLTVGVALLAATIAGCASRVVDVTDQEPPRRTAGAEDGRDQRDAPDTGREAFGDDRPRPYSDPRAMRTADGRPAPYGRDPETGRAINDPLPPPRPSAQSRPMPAPAAVGARAPARGEAGSVVVAKGDTLHSLARRYNVKVDELKRVNGLATDQIKIGQRLAIPGA